MVQSIANFHPLEASILRIQPHTGEREVFAQGLREPFDLTFDSAGQFYATDSGTLEGPVDRILAVDEGEHYGWPFWRTRGCTDCPIRDRRVDIQPDLLTLPDYTLPRGIVAYTGTQFPENVFDSIFVAFWNGTDNAQRIVRIVPDEIPTNEEALALYEPEPFVTGLIRPIDVTLDSEGALVIADFIYGNIWRVRYVGPDFTRPMPERTYVPEETPDFVTTLDATPFRTEPVQEFTNPIRPTHTPGSLFVTSTPRP
jgi:glucose/arabinose dehydrogenase